MNMMVFLLHYRKLLVKWVISDSRVDVAKYYQARHLEVGVSLAFPFLAGLSLSLPRTKKFIAFFFFFFLYSGWGGGYGKNEFQKWIFCCETRCLSKHALL
ncbi:hypothetical protein BDP81DRAFT_166445 [Colletotrichum phormii]|uniref:Uncharacterized protein n=1 Tax=Colletotrichum phormii TaxID=359342 RepID=A0AAJ0A1B3_9PEZI|nr:uncharacterized protein BDP81DRAFT_166445 [Colletotrichum phormii]KAK1640649.1 hypothetical protein BDP81DRAFT_166445 [Colletotrichum phormii]